MKPETPGAQAKYIETGGVIARRKVAEATVGRTLSGLKWVVKTIWGFLLVSWEKMVYCRFAAIYHDSSTVRSMEAWRSRDQYK